MLRNTPQHIVRKINPKNKTDCWFWTGAFNSSDQPVTRLNGKLCYVHRVLWDHYHHIEKRTHNDPTRLITRTCGDKRCVNPYHMQVISAQEHMDYKCRNQGVKQQFTDTEVSRIRLEYRRGLTQVELADMYGVSQQTIHCIVAKKTYKWVA